MDWLDDSGEYPSEAALQRIEAWPSDDITGCFAFVQSIWHWPALAASHEHALTAHEGYVVHAEPGERFLRLATGGWSGNEAIVSAMNRNVLIRARTWRLTARGGLHIYQFPKGA